MTTRAACIETLCRLIERADRNDLAEAQAAIIAYALASPDLPSRSQDMEALQAELADACGGAGQEPLQAAFYSVVDAMIDRTRDAVLNTRGPGGA